jgi:hypothetical protein
MDKLVGVALVLGAAGLGFGVAAFTKTSSALSGRPSSNTAEKETSAPERLRVVERVVVPQEARAAASAEPNPPGQAENAPELAENHPAPSEEERRVYADGVFESETYDAAWAPGAVQHLSSAINAASIEGVRLQSTQCKSNLCKVDLVGDDSDAARRSVKPIVRALKWQGSGMAVMGEPDARGNQAFSLYLTRGDKPLPEPPI